MKKLKFIVLSLVFVVAAVAAMGLFLHKSTVTHAEHRQTVSIQKPEKIKQPDHLPYGFLFRHISNIKSKKYERAEYKNKTGLTDDEFAKVVEVAEKYNKEASEYDAQAKIIIDEVHRAHPPGKLPPGEGPPRPPQELIDLQNSKKQAVINYRDQLQDELGEEPTGRLERFVDKELRKNTKEGKQ